MPKGIEHMNMKLSACLKNAHDRTNHSKTMATEPFTKMAPDIQDIFNRPASIPCYLLFAIAQELEVGMEIYDIIISYECNLRIRTSFDE